MKIDSTIGYHHPLIGLEKPKYGLEGSYGERNVYQSVEKRNNSGSSVNFGAAANFSTKMLDKLLDACNNHTTIVQNLVALVLAVGPRPLAILSLPGKDNKEDKIYASGHSMASGLIGFIFASIIMYPLGLAAKSMKENSAKLIMDRIEKSNEVKLITRRLKKLSQMENIPEDKLHVINILEDTTHIEPDFLKQFGTFEEKDGKLHRLINLNPNTNYEEVYNNYNIENLTKEKLLQGTRHIREKFLDNFIEFDKNGKFVKLNKNIDFDMVFKAVNMAPDTFIFGIIKAMLTVALIPPILKHVFGLEKGKSKKTATEPANNNYYNLTQKAKMAQFLGSTENIKKGAAPSFSGNIPVSSPFLKTPQKLFNKLIDNIEKYYTSYAFSNPLTRKLAHKDDIGRWVDHMQAFGSYTVSGMYMLQTLRNKNMDEDRRTTLAINQGLTLVASTAIAYLVSEKLIAPWNKHVSMKYAASKLNMDPEELSKGLKEHQQKIKKLYFEKHPDQITRENINEKTMKKLYKKKHGSLAGFEEYIDDLIKNKSLELDLKKFKKPNLVHYVDKALKDKGLADKLKGLDVLKSLIIFTSVYRFFGPVLVTPVATWIGNQITKIKKNKKQKSEPAPITPPPTTTNNNKTIYNTMQKPSISQFGVVNKNNAA